MSADYVTTLTLTRFQPGLVRQLLGFFGIPYDSGLILWGTILYPDGIYLLGFIPYMVLEGKALVRQGW